MKIWENFKRDILGVYPNKEFRRNNFRQKRNEMFQSYLETLPKPITILDIGGTEPFWQQANLHEIPHINVTLLNLREVPTSLPNFTSVIADATDLSQYKDNQFDVAFSNSVIEHLLTKENQRKMSTEVLRVSKNHFVQTPNKWFLIEPHYRLPFMQFLPDRLKFWILTKTKLSRMRKYPEDYAKEIIEEIRLLSKKEMKELYPKSQIWSEKFLGMQKSFVAHNFH